MTYAHRNGETQPPTKPGKYWFKGSRLHERSRIGKNHRVEVADIIECADDGEIEPFEYWTGPAPTSWDGQWWGPLVVPWMVTA